MANKLISINTEKPPGTQLPGVVQQEIVEQLVTRVTNVLAGQVTLLRTELDALAAVVAGGAGGLQGTGITPEQAAQLAGLITATQELFDLLAVKPNATLADVGAVWQAVSNQATDFVALLSLLSGQPVNGSVTVADVQQNLPLLLQNIVDMALGKPLEGPLLVSSALTAGVRGDTAEVVAFHPDNKPVNLNLVAPGGTVSVNGEALLSEADVQSKVTSLLNTSPVIGSPNIKDPRIEGVAFTPDGQRVLGFKPGGGGESWLTVSSGDSANPPQIGADGVQGVQHIDVMARPKGLGKFKVHGVDKAATVASVGPWPDTDLNLEAQGDGKVKVEGSPVATEDYLAGVVGPAIQAAVASQVGKVSDRLTLNSTKESDEPFVIETNNLTGAQHKVGINFVTQRGADITINDNRVLTTADALEAGGAGIDQAALEAAVQAATAPLNDKITDLESKVEYLSKLVDVIADADGATIAQAGENYRKLVYREYMEEQFGNFNDLLTADIGATAQLALAEQAKLQSVMDVLGSRKDSTLIHVQQGWENMGGYIQNVEQWANQTINDVLEYVVTEHATKAEVTEVAAKVQEIADGLAGFEQQIADAIPALINEGFDARVPDILTALQTHLENVLAIFGGGGTTGVTPAQITDLTAEFARVYATKEQVAACAKTTDPTQVLTAKSIVLDGIKFNGSNEVLTPITDDYGTRLRLLPQDWDDPTEFPIVITHTDIRELLGEGGRLGMTEKEVAEARQTEMQKLLTGGVDVPPNVDWTPCQNVSGTGLIEVRLINGIVQFRGELKYTQTAAGSYNTVRKLPAGIPAPVVDSNFTAWAIETGATYRIGAIRVGINGTIGVSAPTGKFDGISFGGINYPVF